MKFLRQLFILAVLLLAVPHYAAFADEVDIKNDLAGISAQRINLDTPVSSGLYYISFDMWAADNSADVFCRLNGGNVSYAWANRSSLFDAVAFKRIAVSDGESTPMFTVFGGMTCDWLTSMPADSKKEYNEGVWYEVDIWLDFGKRISTVYLNGEYFDTSVMTEAFAELYGFAFYCDTHTNEGSTADNSGTYFKYRNLSYGSMENDYITSDIEGVTVPQYLREPIDAEIKSGQIGNIYFSPQYIPFDVELRNKSDENRSYTVEYEAFHNGESVWKSSDKININGGETGNERVVVCFDDVKTKYGFFEFKMYLTDISTGEVIERKTRFSVAKRALFPDENMGINHHNAKEWGVERLGEKLELFYSAGFGADRDEIKWDRYEMSKEEYVLPDTMSKWLCAADDRNVATVAIVGYYNDIYKELYPTGEESAPPVDGEYMEKYKLYVENMVRDTIDRVSYYEVWNEWNLAYCNNGAEHYTYHKPEDYVKLVKATYEIVDKINKEKGTDAKVLSFALGYNNGGGAQTFMEDCLNLGICDYSDGISFHPYWTGRNPENNESGSTLKRIRTVKAELAERQIDDMKIVVSELGYPTRNNGDVGEEEQAKWMVRSAAYYRGEIDMLIWYLGQEKIASSEFENSFGIIRPWTGTDIPYEAKPAYLALANYNSLLAGAELISRSPEIDERYSNGTYVNNEQYTYHFKKKNRDIYMLVTMDVNGGQLKCETDTQGKAELIDMYGNSSIIESDEDGVYTVSAESDEPIYILPIKEDMSVSSENGVVSVYGYSDNKDRHSATLQVYTLGWDFASLTNDARNEDYIIVHQDETVVSDGIVKFDLFGIDCTDSVYKVFIYDGDKEYEKYLIYNSSGVGFVIENSDGRAIRDLNSVGDDGIARVGVASDSTAAGETVTLFAAAYSDGALIDVEVRECSFSDEITLFDDKAINVSGADAVQLYLWKDNSSLIPIVSAFRIE